MTLMHATGLVFDAKCVDHNPGVGHPENPDRYRALSAAFEKEGFFTGLSRIPSRAATDDDLALSHTRPYIAIVKRDVARGSTTLSTGDTALGGAASLEVARLAAGSVLAAVDAVCEKKVATAFVAVRPPGHHATASRGMGFCFFNNVALGARYAQRRHKAERVLIVDWDVHHGNGTQDIFYRDPNVFFFSTHQWPWYPGTGAADEKGDGAGMGTTLNCPLPAGAGHAEVVGAFRRKLVPAAEAFKPDLVLISAGFDSRRGDPLGRFQLKDDDFRELTSIILEIAERHAGSRVVSVLEGGYALDGLASATVAHIEALRKNK